jgi:hypothetical protein
MIVKARFGQQARSGFASSSRVARASRPITPARESGFGPVASAFCISSHSVKRDAPLFHPRDDDEMML